MALLKWLVSAEGKRVGQEYRNHRIHEYAELIMNMLSFTLFSRGEKVQTCSDK